MLATLRQRNFALLWTGGLISLLGDWTLMVGMPLFVYALTGSTVATGAMVIARLIPRVLLSSVAGVFVDRWDRKRTMVCTDLLLALCLLPLLAVHTRRPAMDRLPRATGGVLPRATLQPGGTGAPAAIWWARST